jgi:hypothetical protein
MGRAGKPGGGLSAVVTAVCDVCQIMRAALLAGRLKTQVRPTVSLPHN